jgi:branched-chain amino acid transport system substrate-binding protein
MRLLFLILAGSLFSFQAWHLEAGETIKAAAIFSKTGKAAFDNTTALNGVRYAVDELNQNGGLFGSQIELIELDNKSTALGSKIAAKKAVDAGAVIVFGAVWSSHSLAMAPVLQTAGIPMISPYSTHPGLTLIGDYIFRICYTDPFQGKIMASFAFHDLKAKTAAVLTNVSNKFSESLSEYFIDNYRHLGGRVLFEKSYLEKTSDFTSILDDIKKYNPDVIFLPGHMKDSAFIIKQARLNGIKTVFLGGDGWNDFIYKIVGNIVEGSYYTNHWHQDGTGDINRQFMKKYERQNRELDPGYALAEDCVFLFADAVRRANSLKPALIRDAMAATENFEGVTGTISFDKNGDPIKSVVILKFENGSSVYVKTVEP